MIKEQSKKHTVSAPGRLCLIGEHQDYFGLPVIAGAATVRITVDMEECEGDTCEVHMPDIDATDAFRLSECPLPYRNSRDYTRSLINIAHRRGLLKGKAFRAHIRGDIPMQAGISSSSALCVAWAAALSSFYGDEVEAEKMAHLAHAGEVAEFNEPGGMQDHLSSAHGGVIYMDFRVDPPAVERLEIELGTFILGDSGEPKQTIEGIKRIKNGVLGTVEKIQNAGGGENILVRMPYDEAGRFVNDLHIEEESAKLFLGTLATRDLTEQAHKIFKSGSADNKKIGALFNEQHAILRDKLRISTPKIEKLLKAALDAGAYGGKIVGSGGGGCMFAYAPDYPEKVAAAIRHVGGVPMTLAIGEGVKVHK